MKDNTKQLKAYSLKDFNSLIFPKNIQVALMYEMEFIGYELTDEIVDMIKSDLTEHFLFDHMTSNTYMYFYKNMNMKEISEQGYGSNGKTITWISNSIYRNIENIMKEFINIHFDTLIDFNLSYITYLKSLKCKEKHVMTSTILRLQKALKSKGLDDISIIDIVYIIQNSFSEACVYAGIKENINMTRVFPYDVYKKVIETSCSLTQISGIGMCSFIMILWSIDRFYYGTGKLYQYETNEIPFDENNIDYDTLSRLNGFRIYKPLNGNNSFITSEDNFYKIFNRY